MYNLGDSDILRKNQQYTTGSIQFCMHQRRPDNAEGFPQQNGVNELCSKKRTSTKWRFYKLTNLSNFAVLLEVVPMGCKDAV